MNVHGERGIGRDPGLEKILGAAEDAVINRVLEAIGMADAETHTTERRAFVRAYGHLARSAVREWAVKDRLTRDQVRVLLHQTLLAIAQEVIPRTLDGVEQPA